MPEHRRVLEPQNGDVHAAGQPVYPPLRICAVPKGKPEPIDIDEPRRVAEAVATLGLKFAVVTKREPRRR